MFRTVIVLLIAVVFVLLMLPVLLVLWIINLVKPELPLNGAFGCIARIFVPPLLKLAGVRFEVTGQENLPENAADGGADPSGSPRSALYAGNHQGGFDAVVPILFLGKPKSIVMKKEIEKSKLSSSKHGISFKSGEIANIVLAALQKYLVGFSKLFCF